MRKLFILAGLACMVAIEPCFAEIADADDGEYEEIVVRLTKKRPTPQAAPAVPDAPTVVEKPDEPPPPPEPPDADAAEPRRLVRYFCKAWKDQDYERMWWAMSSKYRRKVSLKKFSKLFAADAEQNGGLKDENILEEGETGKGNKSVKAELIFRFPRARHRIVAAEAERQPGGAFRLVESPFIPLDLEDL